MEAVWPSTTDVSQFVFDLASVLAAVFLAVFGKNLVQGRNRNRNDKQPSPLRFNNTNNKRPAPGQIIGTVSELNIFPGKSMTAVTLDKCQVTNVGLQGDRLIMILNHKNVVMTQRILPQLSQIKATVEYDINNNNNRNGNDGDDDDAVVTLSLRTTKGKAYHSPPLVLDLSKARSNNYNNNNKTVVVTVDLHTMKARCVDLGNVAARWINEALTTLSSGDGDDCGHPLPKIGYRVVALASSASSSSSGQTNSTNDDDDLRRIYGSPVGLLMEHARPFDATQLADLAPMTFASEASLQALNQAMPPDKQQSKVDAIPMNRFRTNIVMAAIDGDDDDDDDDDNSPDNNIAFLEDHVRTIQIGSTMIFRSIGPTFRCVIPTVDQTTGIAGFHKNLTTAEPLATLKRFRSGGLRFGLSGILVPTDAGGSKGLAPLFGIFLGTEHAHSFGTVAVGDPIRVLEYKPDQVVGLVAQLIDALAMTLGLDRAA